MGNSYVVIHEVVILAHWAWQDYLRLKGWAVPVINMDDNPMSPRSHCSSFCSHAQYCSLTPSSCCWRVFSFSFFFFPRIKACKTFGDYVKTQDDNNNAKRPKRRKAGIGASEIVMSSTSAAPIMGNVQNCSPSLIPFAMTQQVHSPPVTQMQQQQQQQQQHHQQMQQDLFHKQHHTGSPLLSKAHNFMSAASNLSSLAQVAVPQNTHMYMLTPMMQKFITEKSVYGHQGTIAHSQPQMQQQGQQSPQQSFMYGQTQAQAQFNPFMPMVLSSVSGTPVGSRHSSTVTQSYMIPSQLPMQLQQQPNQPQAQNLFHPSAAANYLSASQLMQSSSTNMNGGTQ